MTIIKLTLFQTSEKVPVQLEQVKRIERKEKGILLHLAKKSIHVQEDAETILKLANIQKW